MSNIARRRSDAKGDFFAHLAIFVLVNSLLVAINLTNSPSILWFLFPLVGWGSGLLIHGLAVFWPLPPDLESEIHRRA